jgi:hypothetical protein
MLDTLLPCVRIRKTKELLYIFFWTWVLNLICKDGHTTISWLLVLFPFILLFVMMGLLLLNM